MRRSRMLHGVALGTMHAEGGYAPSMNSHEHLPHSHEMKRAHCPHVM